MPKTKKLVKKGGTRRNMLTKRMEYGRRATNALLSKKGVVLNRMEKKLQQIFADQNVIIPEQPESELIDVNCLENPCVSIGEGNFGKVYEASYKPKENEKAQNVVLKVLKDENNKEDFEIEKTIGLLLSGHKNVLTLHGEATFPNSTKRCLVFEFCSNGDLLNYLRKPEKIMNYNKKLVILKQICEGMEYIHSKNVLHRDLGARNILLDDCLTAKVADFGLSKNVGSLEGVLTGGSNNYVAPVSQQQQQQKLYAQPSTYGFGTNTNTSYTTTKKMLLPIRWCSPEILNEGKFSKKSDIWAFGVTCYEIFTNGDVPYKEKSKKEVGELISSNKEMAVKSLRLNKQFSDINDLMGECFDGNIEQFADLKSKIKTLSRNNSNNDKMLLINQIIQYPDILTYEYIKIGETIASTPRTNLVINTKYNLGEETGPMSTGLEIYKNFPSLGGGSRKKKRSFKKGGRPKRKQSKTKK